MTILHSLFSFYPIVSSPCLSLFFFSFLLLVSVLFWVSCEIASWLKAFPGEIRVQYQFIQYTNISESGTKPLTSAYAFAFQQTVDDK